MIAIAAAPQNSTRAVARNFGAPPACAPSAPSPARLTSVDATTAGMIITSGASAAATIGTAAATVKVRPEASAAGNGLAACTSDSPNSSRTCAASASFSVNSRATSAAVCGDRPRDS